MLGRETPTILKGQLRLGLRSEKRMKRKANLCGENGLDFPEKERSGKVTGHPFISNIMDYTAYYQ